MAKWGYQYRKRLPDSAFLYIAPSGKRMFPVYNQLGNVSSNHVRNALARVNQAKIPASAKAAVRRKAEKLLMGFSGAKRNPSGDNQYYANPYEYGASGFYFSSSHELEKGLEKAGFEEYEIEFIDGDDAEIFSALAKVVGTHKAFELIEDDDILSEVDAPKLAYALDMGLVNSESDLDDAEDVQMYEGSPEDVVYDWWDEGLISDMDKDRYFDAEAFGRDIRLSGDLEAYADDEELYEELQDMGDEQLGEWYIDNNGYPTEWLDDRTLQMYFDFGSYAQGLVNGGVFHEWRYDGTDYVVVR